MQEADLRSACPRDREVDRRDRSRHDLVQRQVTAGAQYAVDLRVESLFVGDVHRAVLHPDRIETGIWMGHVERAGVTESDEISQASAGGEHLSGATELLCDVQNLHRATDLGR